MDYFVHNSDMTIDLNNNKMDIHFTQSESFRVTLVDTGINTKTAGRLSRIRAYIGGESFMLTYGDGVADININELIKFHADHGKIATVTAIQPEARFGGMEFSHGDRVEVFREKPAGDGQWINGGFFVLSPSVFEYLGKEPDNTMWEDKPLEELTRKGELVAFKHYGFWKCMDAMRDKIELENLWESGNAKWKIWK
jgi:glucose-1-phosphate cytidylyltransferase